MSFWLGYMSSNILQVPGNALQARTTAPDVLTEILEIIARNGESVPSVVATYSRTVDFWLPIISRETLMHRLNNLSTRPTADLALLLLCLHLLNYLPSQSSQQRAEENADYIVAKGLHSALVSSGFDSLQLVQASLMMALLEYGSGLLEKAQLSIALCSKLGRKMIRQQQQLVGGDGIQDTEEGRLWWSIVVMDRCVVS